MAFFLSDTFFFLSLFQFLLVLPPDIWNAWQFAKYRRRDDVWSAMVGILGFLDALVDPHCLLRHLLERVW